MTITVRHRCGRTQVVHAFVRFDLTALGRICISWPLGDFYELDLETGQLVPDAEQDPRVADWSAEPGDLSQLRERYRAAQRVARQPEKRASQQ